MVVYIKASLGSFGSSLKIRSKLLVRCFSKLKFTSAYQTFSEIRNSRKFNESNLNSRKEELDIVSLNLDLTKKININSNLTYGLEFINNKVSSFGLSTDIENSLSFPISSRYPDNSKLMSFGAYMNYKNKIIEDVYFQSGLRYSFTRLEADLSHK